MCFDSVGGGREVGGRAVIRFVAMIVPFVVGFLKWLMDVVCSAVWYCNCCVHYLSLMMTSVVT